MTILLRMDDKMNRQLTCPVSQLDTSMLLAQELVHFGFINEVRELIYSMMVISVTAILNVSSFVVERS